jgi:hypothetical protein
LIEPCIELAAQRARLAGQQERGAVEAAREAAAQAGGLVGDREDGDLAVAEQVVEGLEGGPRQERDVGDHEVELVAGEQRQEALEAVLAAVHVQAAG